ncbi:MAG TPA: hypothetical protein DCO75_01195 [Fibrobacteres bacterium]|nr:hypothetical protein [Fibrobacterota bacterium]
MQHNLVMTIDTNISKDAELKDYAKGQCEATARFLPGFEYIDEKEKSHPLGVQIYEITYKYKPTDELTLFQKQWYMFIDKKAYIFTATFNKKTLNTIAEEVTEIIGSLKVIKED